MGFFPSAVAVNWNCCHSNRKILYGNQKHFQIHLFVPFRFISCVACHSTALFTFLLLNELFQHIFLCSLLCGSSCSSTHCFQTWRVVHSQLEFRKIQTDALSRCHALGRLRQQATEHWSLEDFIECMFPFSTVHAKSCYALKASLSRCAICLISRLTQSEWGVIWNWCRQSSYRLHW